MDDRPLQRKYARIERERRFLLNQLPPAVDTTKYQRLFDLYIEETPLRLRRVESPDSQTIIVKLGQKIPDPDAPDDPRRRSMTTFYLYQTAGSVFAGLAGRTAIKRRYKLPEQGWTFVIDVYEAPVRVAGLVVGEVECETDQQLEQIVMPTWTTREITDESGWSGAELANPD